MCLVPADMNVIGVFSKLLSSIDDFVVLYNLPFHCP